MRDLFVCVRDQDDDEPDLVDALVNVARFAAIGIVAVAGAAVLVQVSQNNLAANQGTATEQAKPKPAAAPLSTAAETIQKAKDKVRADL